jgi:hypothetical protein
MKITSDRDKIKHAELPIGEVYEFCYEYYMKIESVNKDGTVCNAVNLRTGEVTYRGEENSVHKCNARAVIE